MPRLRCAQDEVQRGCISQMDEGNRSVTMMSIQLTPDASTVATRRTAMWGASQTVG